MEKVAVLVIEPGGAACNYLVGRRALCRRALLLLRVTATGAASSLLQWRHRAMSDRVDRWHDRQ